MSHDDFYRDWQNLAEEPLIPNTDRVRWVDRDTCKVHPLATIGTLPFTYLPGVLPRKRKPVKFGVIIKKNVEIMPLSNVDCGTERDTVIGEGTVIDRLVHVAHDVILGKNCILVAGTILGGFVELGDGVYCGINVSVKPRLRIGAGCTIGMGAVVLHNVPPNCVVVGNPGRILRLADPNGPDMRNHVWTPEGWKLPTKPDLKLCVECNLQWTSNPIGAFLTWWPCGDDSNGCREQLARHLGLKVRKP